MEIYDDTIAALATSSQVSALALIRISGADTFSALAKCIHQQERFSALAPKTLGLFTFIHPQTKSRIDQVTVLIFAQGHSYTGEPMAEVICHGGSYIIEQIFKSLQISGVRYAGRGEFTRRAFLNGKMDLSEAESINAIIESKTAIAHQNATANYFGSGKKQIKEWTTELIDVLSELESVIEFPEEESIGELSVSAIFQKINTLLAQLVDEEQKAKMLEKNKDGILLPIVGIVNAGKSSIFNLILNQERAIVHSQAGTTRDVISESIYLQNVPVRLFDTAGLNQTPDEIEKIGIGKTLDLAEKSNHLLWITPADRAFEESEQAILKSAQDKKVFCIINKSDLADCASKLKVLEQSAIPSISVSVKTGAGIKEIVPFLEKQFSQDQYKAAEITSIIQSKRQEIVIQKAILSLQEACFNKQHSLEIVAEDLKRALRAFEEYSGFVSSDAVLDRIFENFCVGK